MLKAESKSGRGRAAGHEPKQSDVLHMRYIPDNQRALHSLVHINNFGDFFQVDHGSAPCTCLERHVYVWSITMKPQSKSTYQYQLNKFTVHICDQVCLTVQHAKLSFHCWLISASPDHRQLRRHWNVMHDSLKPLPSHWHPTTLHSSSATPTLLLEGCSHCYICITLLPLLLIINDGFSKSWCW